MTPDRTGGWAHRYRQGALVYPAPHGPSWSDYADITEDAFLHAYRPGAGDVVLDIGAGFGSEVVAFAPMVGPSGRVVAVEAHPFTCRLLARTIELNRLHNVEVVQAAVTDVAGTAHISDESGLDYEINRLGGGGVEVPATTLDDLVSDLGLDRVDLLKMNIEGAETAALRGLGAAAPTIRRLVVSCHDFLADETGDDGYRTREEVTSTLRGRGYNVFSRNDPRDWIADYVYAARQ